MTILAGLAPGRKGHAALHLGAMLARSSGEDLLLASVVGEPWPPNIGGGDSEYLALRDKIARQALAEADEMIRASVPRVETICRRASSITSGLLGIVSEREISMVALGSSPSSVLGLVGLGGVAERVLHGSSVPVAVAPRGFHAPGARVGRVTVAVGRADQDGGLVASGAALADRLFSSLHAVCFAVRPGALGFTATPGVETKVADEWRQQLEADLAAAADLPAARPADPTGRRTVRVELGVGGTWADAMLDVTWTGGDLLVVGTSSGPFSRFYVGSHAAKIIRNSPVPVVLMPRVDRRSQPIDDSP
ncbi:universal stress protein [Microlunatus ginsengisoli]|uniref:Universal stress protein n=1 Tax=Microlunatus ginsengisoli TaxID=363863 RepID=A0ABP7AX63_9ACTN